MKIKRENYLRKFSAKILLFLSLFSLIAPIGQAQSSDQTVIQAELRLIPTSLLVIPSSAQAVAGGSPVQFKAFAIYNYPGMVCSSPYQLVDSVCLKEVTTDLTS